MRKAGDCPWSSSHWNTGSYQHRATPRAAAISTDVCCSTPRIPPQSCKKDVLSSSCLPSLQPTNHPCKIREAASLWVFTSCAGFWLCCSCIPEASYGLSKCVCIGSSDVYEVSWWYDFYYSTWTALAFIFDHRAWYLLYAVSHGWLCTFVLGVLTL